MTLQEKITEEVAKRKAAQAASDSVLAKNSAYVDYRVDMEVAEATKARLDTIITQLNSMKVITTQDGNRYGVHCYPIAESIFGAVMARVLAIIDSVGAMFTDERQREYVALTHIPYLIALDATKSIGKPAYFNKTMVVPGVDGQLNTTAITAVCHSLGIDISYAAELSQAQIDRWHTTSAARAETKLLAYTKVESLDTAAFIITD